jgi:hypothetical protein
MAKRRFGGITRRSSGYKDTGISKDKIKLVQDKKDLWVALLRARAFSRAARLSAPPYQELFQLSNAISTHLRQRVDGTRQATRNVNSMYFHPRMWSVSKN